MKVLFVAEYFPPLIMGGGEINLFSIAQALATQGIEVSVLTSTHPHLQTYEKMDQIHVYRRLKTGSKPENILQNFQRSWILPKSLEEEITKLTRQIDPEIIHFLGISVISAPKVTHLGKLLFATIESLPALCPKGDKFYHGKTECIIQCTFDEFLKCQQNSTEIGKMKNKFYLKHNPLFHRYLYNHYLHLNRSLKDCHLIAISKYVHKLLSDQDLASIVIPNALEVDRFQPRENKHSKPHLLYLGSLTRYKGPQILLEAVQGLNCHIDFYGEGNLKEELQRSIQENNIDAQIHTPVPYENIPEIYARADIVVFPSLWPEPFGRIAIEAIAAGKPVIASQIGAIPETVPEKFLFEAGNASQLRDLIKEQIENPSSINMDLSVYSLPVVATKIIRRYQEALDGHS